MAGGCRLAGLVAAEGGSEVILLYRLALVHLYLQSLTFHIKLKGERCGDMGMGRIDLVMGQGLVWIGGVGSAEKRLCLRRWQPQLGTELLHRARLAPSDGGREHLCWRGNGVVHGVLGVQSSPALLCLPKIPTPSPPAPYLVVWSVGQVLEVSKP